MGIKQKESIAIITSVFLPFLVQNAGFSNLTPYLLAIFILCFFIYSKIKKSSKSDSSFIIEDPIDLFCITIIIILILTLTNGLNSPVFFFLYLFILFLAFIATTPAIWIFLACILLFFVPQMLVDFSIENIIKLASLLLITPISYFMSRELIKHHHLAQKIEAKTEEIIQEAQVLKEEASLKTEESEALDEIIEEAASIKNDVEEKSK